METQEANTTQQQFKDKLKSKVHKDKDKGKGYLNKGKRYLGKKGKSYLNKGKDYLGKKLTQLRQQARDHVGVNFSAVTRIRPPNLRDNLDRWHKKLQKNNELLLVENPGPTWWMVFLSHWLFYVTNCGFLGLGIATIIYSNQARTFEYMLNKLDQQQTYHSDGIKAQLGIGISLVVMACLGYLCWWGSEGTGMAAHGLTSALLGVFTLFYSIFGFIDSYFEYFPERISKSFPVALAKFNNSNLNAIRVQMFQEFLHCCGFDSIDPLGLDGQILASCCGTKVVFANSSATCEVEDLQYPTLCIDAGLPSYITVVSHLNYYMVWVAFLAAVASCHLASTYNRPFSLGIPPVDTSTQTQSCE